MHEQERTEVNIYQGFNLGSAIRFDIGQENLFILNWGQRPGSRVGEDVWLPKWTGHMYDETLAKTHFWLSMFFFNLTFFVQHFLCPAGCPGAFPTMPCDLTIST
jgi:hypothetical protein